MRTLLLLLIASSAHAQDLLPIAIDDREVPGHPGVFFEGDLASVSVDSAGRVAFTMGARDSMSASRGDALWLLTGEGFQLIAGPDLTGIERAVDTELVLTNADAPVLLFDDDGVAYLTSNGGDLLLAIDTGLVSGTPSSTTIAGVGADAPGGGTFAELSGYSMRPGGLIAFRGVVGGTESFYRYEEGTLTRIVTPGDTVAGQTITGLRSAHIDERGWVYFDATTDGPGGIFRHAGGVASAVVVPDMSFGSNAGFASWTIFPRTGVVFVGERWIDDGGGGFATERLVQQVNDGATTDLVTTGTTFEGGGTYVDASVIQALDDGAVVIEAGIDVGTGVNDIALVFATGTDAFIVATLGDTIDESSILSFGNAIEQDRLPLIEVGEPDGVSIRLLPEGLTPPLFTPNTVLYWNPPAIEDFLPVSSAFLAARRFGERISRPSGGDVLCVHVMSGEDRGLACTVPGPTAGGIGLELGVDIQPGLLMGFESHVAASASLGLMGVMESIPTWSLEGTFSTPVVAGRIFVADGDTEREEVCDARTNAAGLVTGFVCSQTDSTTLPLESDASLDVFVLVDLPATGLPDDRLQVDWILSGEDESGEVATVTAVSVLEDATVSDIAVRLIETTDEAHRIEIAIVDGSDTISAVVTVDDPAASIEGCTISAVGSEGSCTVDLISRDFPLNGMISRHAGFVRIAHSDTFWPVDPNPDNNELTFPAYTPPTSGCSASTGAIGWPFLVLALWLRRRRR